MKLHEFLSICNDYDKLLNFFNLEECDLRDNELHQVQSTNDISSEMLKVSDIYS